MLRAAIVASIVLSATCAVGQGSVSPKPDAANGGIPAYSNECFALAYRPPDGWKFSRERARPSKQLMTLFKVDRHSAARSAESLQLDAMDTPTLKHPNMERFTILMALSLVHVNGARNKITRDAYPVTAAGRSFYRSDLLVGDKLTSVLTTWYRRYAIVAWAYADSPQKLEDAVNALSALKFGEDKRTGECFGFAN